jgi:hypothetical protein
MWPEAAFECESNYSPALNVAMRKQRSGTHRKRPLLAVGASVNPVSFTLTRGFEEVNYEYAKFIRLELHQLYLKIMCTNLFL